MLKAKDIKDKLSFNKNVIAPKLRAAGQDKLADKVERCSETSRIATCVDCGTKYYAGSEYCKSRYCAVCTKLRAMAWLAKLVPLLKQYSAEGYKIFMLNLTIKDDEDLDRVLTRILKAWRIMTHDDKTCAKRFRLLNHGGVRSIEIKQGENSKQWHPHIHSIVLLKTINKVKQFNEYRKIWEHATGVACGTVNKVGSVYLKGLKSFDGEIISAVIETFKYFTKLDWLNVPNDKLNELIIVTKNRHFISSWGVLYALNRQVEELLAKESADAIQNRACTVCGCTLFELENVLTSMLPDSVKDFDA